MDYAILLLIFGLPILIALLQWRKAKRLSKELQEQQANSKRLKVELFELEERFKPVSNAELEAKAIIGKARSQAGEIIGQANQEAEATREKATQHQNQTKAALQKANQTLEESRKEREAIIEKAREEALVIAGSALEAKEKADQYQSAITAMRNTIEGYRDDYIIPNHSVLDDLAEEYSHKEAGEQLKATRKKVRNMVKQGLAGDCDYVQPQRKMEAIHFAVDAFNGKVDSALSKVKHDNFGKIRQEILDAYALVNHNGSGFRNARIQKEYLDARLDELKWAVATHELRQQELAEQREIREQMREEEKARREMEKAIKEAEKEERMLQQAMEKARKELAGASEEQRQQYEDQLNKLQEQLQEAEAKGQRAISMAQQTKQGHVYIISNIGSFGENVFKIGMTRRLEPLDRVKELGDASVPFNFDVHAMIHSKDAPALEKDLHRRFELDQINKLNPRKEFFRLPLATIRQAIEQHGIQDIHWTMKVEAAEYRESLAIQQQQLQETGQIA